MTKLRLTDVTVRNLTFTPTGQIRHFDATTPNFGVIVGTRSKSFFVVRGKDRRLTTIGRYPDISLADARKEAKRLLASNLSPSPSVRHTEALEAYLADCRTRLRPRTVEEYERPLRKGADLPLDEYTRKTVASTNSHTLMAWKVYFNWCVKHELATKNPFQHERAEYGQRSRVLSDAEICAIWQYEHSPFSDLIKLCLLTGQRRREVTNFAAHWVHEDTITVPADIAKNGREHTIPFNLLTARYLVRYLGQSFNGFSKGKARLDRHHPLPHWTIHDLRRTFATKHARLGTPIHVVEAMLNHASGTVSGVAAIYIRHNFLDEARKAALLYEQHIAKLVAA